MKLTTRTITHVAFLTAAAMSCAHAHAQVVSNTYQALADCTQAFSQPATIGGSGTLTANGSCETVLGIVSTNSANTFMLSNGGIAEALIEATSNCFAVSGSSFGRAQGVADFAHTYSDIVFSNTANPGATGPVNVSMNFIVESVAHTAGTPDTISNTPISLNRFRVNFGSGSTIGTYQIRPSGNTITGSFVGYPNDGSPLALTTPSATATLGSPFSVVLSMTCSQTINYFATSGLARTATASAEFRMSLPCGTPVFNLPPGFNANSVSLGIVNNIWQNGACGRTCDSIDFNNDSSLFDPQDIDAFLSVFSEGPCIPAANTCNDIDFNNDSSVFDPQDIDAFLSVFAEGPCI